MKARRALSLLIPKTIIYQGTDGAIELKTSGDRENIWASQAQIVELFKIDQSVVSKHINKIFKDGELDKESNMQKMHIANSDKPVAFYSLDVILAVGYRTNSKVAVDFRKWATITLRDLIINGIVVDKKRNLRENREIFTNALDNIKYIMSEDKNFEHEEEKLEKGTNNFQSIIQLIKEYAETWLSLDAYDKNNFNIVNVTKASINLTSEELRNVLNELKIELIKQGEASELFAKERSRENIEGVLGNIMQTFDGVDLYESLEEKAAHLLYFLAKDHIFTDGNKRSAAFSFIWFLQKISYPKIDPQALTTLTLLVAESNPKDKEKMISLIMSLLGSVKKSLPYYKNFNLYEALNKMIKK